MAKGGNKRSKQRSAQRRGPRNADSRSKQRSAPKAGPELCPLGVDLPLDFSADRENVAPGGLAISANVFYEIAQEMHPDFVEFTSRGRRLPDELPSTNGETWSPNLHLNLHSNVEERLAKNDPPGILQLAQRLESEGKIGTHQIRHILMDAIATQIWQMQKNGKTPAKPTLNPQDLLDEIEAGYRRLADAE